MIQMNKHLIAIMFKIHTCDRLWILELACVTMTLVGYTVLQMYLEKVSKEESHLKGFHFNFKNETESKVSVYFVYFAVLFVPVL